jgi:hypothetical protein
MTLERWKQINESAAADLIAKSAERSNRSIDLLQRVGPAIKRLNSHTTPYRCWFFETNIALISDGKKGLKFQPNG